MRIDIVAIGSRGDVQPFVALGLGLQRAGHSVRLVTLAGFEDFIRGHGLTNLVIGSSPREISNTVVGRDWVKRRSSTLGFLRGFARVAAHQVEGGISRYSRDCEGVEALIVSPMGLLVGIHIAEKLGVPLMQSMLEPLTLPTRYDWDCRRSLSAAASTTRIATLQALFHFVLWSALLRAMNAARAKFLGLQPLSLVKSFTSMFRKRTPMLLGYSQTVVPKPPDYGKWVHSTGYWFLDDLAEWTPPDELVAFLSSGTPPVFVGFGGTPFPKPETTTDLVVRALTRAGRRGILVAGESGLTTGRLSENVLSMKFVPYGWLFPQVYAVVHQGGAGVTGAALRAGLPSVVVPVFGVHPTWGNRIFHLGAGPRPIPATRLTEENLAAAIQATANPAIRKRAEEIGEAVRAEDGVGRAVEVIETHVKGISGQATRCISMVGTQG